MHSLEILLVICAPAHYVLILLSITLATLKVYAVVLMLKNKNVLSLTGFTKLFQITHLVIRELPI